MIYAFGDSHVYALDGRSDIKVTALGAATAYQLDKQPALDTPSFGDKLKQALDQLESGDVALLSFGEIDCRVHIGYQEDKQRVSRELLVARTAVHYVDFVVRLRVPPRLLFLGIPPCGERDNIYHVPVYLPVEERSRIYRQFNSDMLTLTKMVGLGYVNQHDQFGDAAGMMLPEYLSTQQAHLNRKTAGWVMSEVNWLLSNS